MGPEQTIQPLPFLHQPVEVVNEIYELAECLLRPAINSFCYISDFREMGEFFS
jgi:hypothetical protein